MSTKFFCRLAAFAAMSAFACGASAWRIDMNFNNGTVGQKAQGSGGFSDAAGATYYTSENYYEGGKAAQLSITKGDTAFGNWGGVINHPTLLKKGDQIWFRVRTYMPVGFNYNSTGEGGHLKFLRIHTQTTGGSNEGYDDWYINPKGSAISHKFIFEGEQVWDEFASSQYAPDLGKWETYEFYVKFDNVPVSAGGTGRVRVWKDGVLLKDITNRKTLATASSVSDRTHLFTYWNGGAPATQKMYVDDIVLTSDTPSAVDAKGNPYVGMGEGAPVSVNPPSAPTLRLQ